MTARASVADAPAREHRRAARLRSEARAAAVELYAARVECDRLARGGPVVPTASAAADNAPASILAGAALAALDVARLASVAADHADDAAALEAVAERLAALRLAGR